MMQKLNSASQNPRLQLSLPQFQYNKVDLEKETLVIMPSEKRKSASQASFKADPFSSAKGVFTVVVKSARIDHLPEKLTEFDPFVQVIFGDRVASTKICDNSDQTPAWNETFNFPKNQECRLGLQIISGSVLVGMQEVGINTFIKKRSTIDHPVELMREGAVIGEILLNIEYSPKTGPTNQWQSIKTQPASVSLHKLLISKLKATLDSDNSHSNPPSFLSNPQLRITVGKRLWNTSQSTTPGKNLSWTESFKIIIENEQELCLEVVAGAEANAEEKFGTALIKLKQLKEGFSQNKIPIIYEGHSVGFFYFSTEYSVPQISKEVVKIDRNLDLVVKPGRLTLNSFRLYLDKGAVTEDAHVLILWGGELLKTEVYKGASNKPEWKELLTFKQFAHDFRLQIKLLDKSNTSEDDYLGFGTLYLDPTFLQGGKFRSQKVELHTEEQPSVGQLYLDYEYQLDNQGVVELVKNDPFDMKKQSRPSEEEMKKREMLNKRKELMKASALIQERNNKLPMIDESNIFTQAPSRPPQPKSAVKAVHSVSLPKINYEIKVNEYNRIYKDSMFGLGMSNLHSATSLRHSIPSFSLSKADRFPQKNYAGVDSLNSQSPSLFGVPSVSPYQISNKKIFTPDQKYQIFHRSPNQKVGSSFGVGNRFKEQKKDNGPGFYQGPQLFNYQD